MMPSRRFNPCRSALPALLVGVFLHSAPAAAQQNVNAAIQAIVTLCMAGGSISSVVSQGNSINLNTDVGSVIRLNKSEAQGFVDGLPSALNAYSADQAREARRCMQPHLARIVDIILQSAPQPPTVHERMLRQAVTSLQAGRYDYQFYTPQFVQSFRHLFAYNQNLFRSFGELKAVNFIAEVNFGIRRFSLIFDQSSIVCEIGLQNNLIAHFSCV